MTMKHLLTYLAHGALALGLAAPAAAQVNTLDEGSFTITRGGTTIGREQFKIVSTPGAGGASFVASATVSYEDRKLSPALRTSQTGAPLAYQIEVKVGSETQQSLRGQIGRGRFSARIQTPQGESAREYIVADGALILDEDVFHQYYFLARGARSGSVPVVVPHRNVQVVMRIEERGPTTVSIGGQSLPARLLVLVEPGGANREIWVDRLGRVLKVTIATRGITATRDDPPR